MDIEELEVFLDRFFKEGFTEEKFMEELLKLDCADDVLEFLENE